MDNARMNIKSLFHLKEASQFKFIRLISQNKNILQEVAPFHLRRLPDVEGPDPSVALDKSFIKF